MDVTLDILIAIAALILSGLGIIGCIAPGLPGPPLNYIAVLIYHFGVGKVMGVTWLIISLVIVIAVAVFDYVLPPYVTKKFGGTKWGVWGGIIGLVVGFFFPYGIVIGPLLGAIIGDLIAGQQFESALKSGVGSFIGFVAATAAKLAVSIVLTVILIVRMGIHVFDSVFR